MSPLHFDTREEAVYFLSVIRNDPGFSITRWVGAFQDDEQWIWRDTNERINFELPWASNFPIVAPGNCLSLNRHGFVNSAACTSTHLYFCQKIGG